MEHILLPLKKRPDFLAVRNGEKRRGALFLLSLKKRDSKYRQYFDEPRIGLTVTKKNGNAVCRNRIKRRLRAAIRVGNIASLTEKQTDYVIIAHAEILTVPFERLVEELQLRMQNKKKQRVHFTKK